MGGYTGTFTVACNNLPANASCQFMQNGSPSNTVVMSGNNQPTQVGLVVATSIAHAQAEPRTAEPRSRLPLILNCGGLVALVFLGRRRKSHRGVLALCGSIALGAILAGGMTGCAGGGFGVNSTALGTSVATVTASATGSTAPAGSLSLTITIIQ